jgi:hypothetical protein
MLFVIKTIASNKAIIAPIETGFAKFTVHPAHLSFFGGKILLSFGLK